MRNAKKKLDPLNISGCSTPDWPKSCPQPAGVITDDEPKHFPFVNKHSGQRFEVTLKQSNGIVWMHELKLLD